MNKAFEDEFNSPEAASKSNINQKYANPDLGKLGITSPLLFPQKNRSCIRNAL